MGCLNGSEKLDHAITTLRAARYNPRISGLEQQALIAQLQFGAPSDHVTDGFIIAHARWMVLARLDIFPQTHRQTNTAGEIFLPHCALRRRGRIYFVYASLSHGHPLLFLAPSTNPVWFIL